MKTQPKYLQWWNTLGDRKRDELAMDYYGSDLIMDDEIEKIYLDQYRYYIEFDGKRKFLCLFPFPENTKNKEFKSLEDALNYMLDTHKINEVTIRN